jgi:predicted HTH transcriptional regulator
MIDSHFFSNQIQLGEDSRRQFKETLGNPGQAAAEIVAFLNGQGGFLFVGVGDDGAVTGIDLAELRRINQLVSSVATDLIKPPPIIRTYTETLNGRLVLMIEVPEGINKPYCDNEGRFWVKQGADKRKVVAPEELQRLFQAGHKLYADERIVPETSLDEIDISSFAMFYEKKFSMPFAAAEMPFGKILNALGLAKNGSLTLAALLLFGRNSERFCPNFKIQAVAVRGIRISADSFLDKCECEGRISDQFRQALNFVQRNLRMLPDSSSGFNQPGNPEIRMEAVSELLVNALVHRDYFVNASVKLLIFEDRIELQSPGVLPNSLTVENIRVGISVPRNSILLSHAQFVLPYSGLGSGIPRALKYCPNILLNNDLDANRFIVKIPRVSCTP